MRAMRVALVHMRHAASGGTERYLNQLADQLAAAGWEVTVICRSHVAPSRPSIRFEVLRPVSLGGAWRMWAFARAVERHLGEHVFDVVLGLGKTWTHDVVRLGGGAHATYLELAHRDTQTPLERALGKGALKQRLALAAERRALAPGAYRRVIANSGMVARDVERRYGVPAERIAVIHNGVDLERFHPRRRAAEGAALRNELGFGERDLVLLFLGTGYGRKGLDTLLQAFARIADQRPASRLIVAGYDSSRARFEEQARTLGLSERVRFLGGRSDPETCFAAADLYVLPTRYDPFANTTLEALASGLPVLTTHTNGAAELIRPGEHGEVVPPADSSALAAALERWTEDGRAEAARWAARALAELHSAGRAAQETERVLREVAGEVAASRASARVAR
jgi:UDP-glucose:(heptosyl)LPS alpha-1,3-glucosyltransferase